MLGVMPRKPLGIRAGETWAYRPGANEHLRPVTVIDPGTNYYAQIRIRLLDEPGRLDLWVRRVKLPCKWDEREAWMAAHPQYRPVDRVAPEPEGRPLEQPPVTVSIVDLRRIIREEVAAAVAPTPLAYDLTDAARMVGLSTETLRRAVRRDELIASYWGNKPVFRVEELSRWLRSLPEDYPRRSRR